MVFNESFFLTDLQEHGITQEQLSVKRAHRNYPKQNRTATDETKTGCITCQIFLSFSSLFFSRITL
jgi:hypothetical protein